MAVEVVSRDEDLTTGITAPSADRFLVEMQARQAGQDGWLFNASVRSLASATACLSVHSWPMSQADANATSSSTARLAARTRVRAARRCAATGAAIRSRRAAAAPSTWVANSA